MIQEEEESLLIGVGRYRVRVNVCVCEGECAWVCVGGHPLVGVGTGGMVWALQAEELPLLHAAWPGASLHLTGKCAILREL